MTIEEASMTRNGTATGGLSGRRILVVEDEYFVADDITRTLQRAGAQVLGPVPTPEQALGLISTGETPDFAVLDINLRGDLVYPVADALTERGVPFVFATGYDAASVAAAYSEVPRWEKPFDPVKLVQAVGRSIEQR
jgi:CheY-like chemotaxis protein